MSKKLGLLVVLGALLISPAIGHAAEMGTPGAKWTLSLTQDYTASPWTHETGWSNRAIGKLGFGAKNLLLGWTDLFMEPKQAMDEGGNFFKGLGIGIKDTVENELGGALHVVTFPITALDVPLPEGGVQLFNS